MKLLYLAGPIAAASPWEVEANVRLAEEVSRELLLLGAAVHCPHTQGRYFHKMFPLQEWLRRDFEVLRRCDGMVMLPNWRSSPGSVAERAYATRLGLPIFPWPLGSHLIEQWLKTEALTTCLQCGRGLSTMPRKGKPCLN